MKVISDANTFPEDINYANKLLIYAWTRQKSRTVVCFDLEFAFKMHQLTFRMLLWDFVADFEI